MSKLFKKYGISLAWIISIIATGISLYFSQVLQWETCTLCWYQRIAMYPLVVLLGIANFRNDSSIVVYTLPLAAVGSLLSLINYLVEKIEFYSASLCTNSSCVTEYINLFGFITIPFLALLAFLLIFILLWAHRYYGNSEKSEPKTPGGDQMV